MQLWRDLWDEFKSLLAARGGAVDALLPGVVFALLRAIWSLTAAVLLAALTAGLLAGWRVRKGDRPFVALGGLALVLFAAALALISGRASSFFLADLVQTAAMVLASVVSLAIGRPLVALTSHLFRGFPLAWYWHPKVRPAYSEVTAAWSVYLTAQAVIQYAIYRSGEGIATSWVQLILGWPATVLLLAATYLYGIWRLARLKGPSVAEFRADAPPPWAGQRKGF